MYRVHINQIKVQMRFWGGEQFNKMTLTVN